LALFLPLQQLRTAWHDGDVADAPLCTVAIHPTRRFSNPTRAREWSEPTSFDAVAEIIDWFIDGCQTRDTLAPPHSAEAALGAGFGTRAVVDTPLRFRAGHMVFLSMVAERSGTDVSRTTRQIIDQFAAGLLKLTHAPPPVIRSAVLCVSRMPPRRAPHGCRRTASGVRPLLPVPRGPMPRLSSGPWRETRRCILANLAL